MSTFMAHLRSTGKQLFWLGTLLLAGVVFLSRAAPTGFLPPIHLVAAILSLLAGFRAAFLLDPDGEEMLELLGTFPPGYARILLERWLALLLWLTLVGLAGTLGHLLLVGGRLPALLLSWLPPIVFFSGLVLFVVQATHRGNLGLLLLILLWAGLFLGGDSLLVRWPFLLPIHAFLRPERAAEAAYLFNRLALLLVGSGLGGWAILLLRNEERVLQLR